MTHIYQDPFQAIADPGRRQILAMLSTGKMSVNAIASNFDISRPAVSKHLKILNEAGFIAVMDVGRERYCQLSEQGFDEVKQWLAFYDQFWTARLQALGNLLSTRDASDKAIPADPITKGRRTKKKEA